MCLSFYSLVYVGHDWSKPQYSVILWTSPTVPYLNAFSENWRMRCSIETYVTLTIAIGLKQAVSPLSNWVSADLWRIVFSLLSVYMGKLTLQILPQSNYSVHHGENPTQEVLSIPFRQFVMPADILLD